MRLGFLIAANFLLLLSGCGVGLCIGYEPGGGCYATETGPRLLLSGLEGLSIRKNDCYPLTLSALDAEGNALSNVSATVTLTASSGVVFYSSLTECQTYDAAGERTSFSLSPSTPQLVFYFRSDVEGEVSISAGTSVSLGLAAATRPLSVVYSAFDGAAGTGGTLNAYGEYGDGRLYIGGYFNSYDDFPTANLARIKSDGTVDSSFVLSGTGFNDGILSIYVQPNGDLVVGGEFTSYNGTTRNYIARVHSDGSLDGSFAPAGTGLNGDLYAVRGQSDGKLIVAGRFTAYNGTAASYLARLNSDGSLDTTFVQAGTGFDDEVNAIFIQSDGKIVVGGAFTDYNGSPRSYVARLNSDGSLDGTFVQVGAGLGFSDVDSLLVQADGKVMVGGEFTTYGGTARSYLARLNGDGSLDTSFAPTGTGLNDWVLTITQQGDGKYVVGGYFTSYNGTARARIARLNTDGSLDSTFVVGTGFNYDVNLLAAQGNGQFVALGGFYFYNGNARRSCARVNSDGSFDSTFGRAQAGFSMPIGELALQSDNKPIVSGNFTNHSGTAVNYLARLNTDGTLDTTFTQTGTGLNSTASDIEVQTDGKVAVGGFFSTYNGTSRPNIARFHSDGSLDTAFMSAGTGLNGGVRGVAIQPDGAILVAGAFSSYNGTNRPSVARLTSGGSLDTTFVHTGTGLNGQANEIAIQSDGKPIVVGTFTGYNGTPRNYIARLNTDGSLDTSFNTTGTGLDSSVNNAVVLPDGRLLVVGNFTTYNGSATPYVVRLNSDGSRDMTFSQAGTGFAGSSGNVVTVQSDGKILVGGIFQTYNGTSRRNLARLHSDGTLDTSFAANGWPDGSVQGIRIQSDKKLVIVGSFREFAQATVNYIARLTYIGTLD